MLPAMSFNLLTRISGSLTAMQLATERDCECVPVKAHAPQLAPSCNDTGSVPTQAPVGVQTETVAHGETIGGVHCQRDLSKAKSRVALPKAAGCETSSSYHLAPNRTLNTWPSFVQVGGAASSLCEHGVTKRIAPTAILTAYLPSSGRTSVIGASFPCTSRAIRTCRAIARLPQTPRVRPLYSTDLKRTVLHHGLTTDLGARAAA